MSSRDARDVQVPGGNVRMISRTGRQPPLRAMPWLTNWRTVLSAVMPGTMVVMTATGSWRSMTTTDSPAFTMRR